MPDVTDVLNQLQSKKQKLEQSRAAQKATLDAAESQREKAVAELKRLGVDDPAQASAKLKSIQAEADGLLAQIEAELPERYREGF